MRQTKGKVLQPHRASHLGRLIACALAIVSTCGGCAKQTAAAALAGKPVASTFTSGRFKLPLSVEDLISVAGEPCDTQVRNGTCMNDEADVELIPDCASHGYYAAVKNPKGTSVLSNVPPQNNVVRSTISDGQLVCVQAAAWIKGYLSYAFVTAVSGANTTTCHDCAGHGDREVLWNVPHQQERCKEVAPGRFEGGCVVGWVDGDDLKLLGKTR